MHPHAFVRAPGGVLAPRRRRPLCSPRRRRRPQWRVTLSPPPQPPLQPAADRPTPRGGAVTDLRSVSELLALVAAGGAGEGLVVVEVHSRSCRACLGVRRTYERVAERYAARARFARVSVDDVPDVRRELNVQAMPLFVFYKGGARVDHHAGGGRERLEQAIDDNL